MNVNGDRPPAERALMAATCPRFRSLHESRQRQRESPRLREGNLLKFLALLMNEPERETNDDHDEDVADQRPNHAGSGSRIASAR